MKTINERLGDGGMSKDSSPNHMSGRFGFMQATGESFKDMTGRNSSYMEIADERDELYMDQKGSAKSALRNSHQSDRKLKGEAAINNTDESKLEKSVDFAPEITDTAGSKENKKVNVAKLAEQDSLYMSEGEMGLAADGDQTPRGYQN